MPPSIAYIMSRFPHLPETFILREMLEMQKLGWNVEVFPIIEQHQPVKHTQVGLLDGHIHIIKMFSWDVFKAAFRLFVINPRLSIHLLFTIFRENWSNRKFLLRSLAILPISIRMAELISKAGIQHIHAHYATHPALAAWIINKITGIPYTITVHAHDIFVDKPMLCTKLMGADNIIAISKFNVDYLQGFCPPSITEKIQVIHCGIEPEKYIPRQDKQRNSPFKIIHIGSLQPYKGQKYLIQACKLLKDRGLVYSCDLIGGGELERDLSLLINKFCLEESIHLLGPLTQDQIADRLPQAGCYVQPSIITETGKMEGIPVGIMEAMASGVPVITSAISGIPEIVVDKKTGLLVPPEDPIALADAIQLIFNDEMLASEMVENAHLLVNTEFNLHANVTKFSNILLTKTGFLIGHQEVKRM